MNTLKSDRQNRLYHAYIRQLYNHGVIKIDMVTQVWEDDLKQYVYDNYSTFKKKSERKDIARYLLKIMDIELPTRNAITSSNMNKNHFDKAFKEDLTHHISWLREQLVYNNIEPYNG